MEETELKLKELITNRYGNLKKFCEKINMPWTTLDSILKRGISNSNISNVMKITNELNIDTESLAYGIIKDRPINQTVRNLSSSAQHLLQTYNQLTIEEQKLVYDYTQFIYSKGHPEKGDMTTTA